jgi:hypothetical protein
VHQKESRGARPQGNDQFFRSPGATLFTALSSVRVGQQDGPTATNTRTAAGGRSRAKAANTPRAWLGWLACREPMAPLLSEYP